MIGSKSIMAAFVVVLRFSAEAQYAVSVIQDISGAYHAATAQASELSAALETEMKVYQEAIDASTKDIRAFTNDIKSFTNDIKSYTNEVKDNLGQARSFAASVGDDVLSVADPIEEIGDMAVDNFDDANGSDAGKEAAKHFDMRGEVDNFRSQFDKYKSARAKLKSYAQKYDNYRKMRTNLKSKTLNESNMQIAESIQAGQSADEKNHQEVMGAMNLQTQSLALQWKRDKMEAEEQEKVVESQMLAPPGRLDKGAVDDVTGTYSDFE